KPVQAALQRATAHAARERVGLLTLAARAEELAAREAGAQREGVRVQHVTRLLGAREVRLRVAEVAELRREPAAREGARPGADDRAGERAAVDERREPGVERARARRVAGRDRDVGEQHRVAQPEAVALDRREVGPAELAEEVCGLGALTGLGAQE